MKQGKKVNRGLLNFRQGNKKFQVIQQKAAKFDPPKHELNEEELLTIMQPRNHYLKEVVSTFIDKSIQNAVTESEKAAWHIWKAHTELEQVEGKEKTKFVRDFNAWLLGQGEQRDHDNTPWGRQPRINDESVRAYIGAWVDAKFDFTKKIQLLVLKGAGLGGVHNIKELYLYFKYVIRGSWDNIEVADFLHDWNQYFCEAKNYGEGPVTDPHLFAQNTNTEIKALKDVMENWATLWKCQQEVVQNPVEVDQPGNDAEDLMQDIDVIPGQIEPDEGDRRAMLRRLEIQQKKRTTQEAEIKTEREKEAATEAEREKETVLEARLEQELATLEQELEGKSGESRLEILLHMKAEYDKAGITPPTNLTQDIEKLQRVGKTEPKPKRIETAEEAAMREEHERGERVRAKLMEGPSTPLEDIIGPQQKPEPKVKTKGITKTLTKVRRVPEQIAVTTPDQPKIVQKLKDDLKESQAATKKHAETIELGGKAMEELKARHDLQVEQLRHEAERLQNKHSKLNHKEALEKLKHKVTLSETEVNSLQNAISFLNQKATTQEELYKNGKNNLDTVKKNLDKMRLSRDLLKASVEIGDETVIKNLAKISQIENELEDALNAIKSEELKVEQLNELNSKHNNERKKTLIAMNNFRNLVRGIKQDVKFKDLKDQSLDEITAGLFTDTYNWLLEAVSVISSLNAQLTAGHAKITDVQEQLRGQKKLAVTDLKIAAGNVAFAERIHQNQSNIHKKEKQELEKTINNLSGQLTVRPQPSQQQLIVGQQPSQQQLAVRPQPSQQQLIVGQQPDIEMQTTQPVEPDTGVQSTSAQNALRDAHIAEINQKTTNKIVRKVQLSDYVLTFKDWKGKEPAPIVDPREAARLSGFTNDNIIEVERAFEEVELNHAAKGGKIDYSTLAIELNNAFDEREKDPGKRKIIHSFIEHLANTKIELLQGTAAAHEKPDEIMKEFGHDPYGPGAYGGKMRADHLRKFKSELLSDWNKAVHGDQTFTGQAGGTPGQEQTDPTKKRHKMFSTFNAFFDAGGDIDHLKMLAAHNSSIVLPPEGGKKLKRLVSRTFELFMHNTILNHWYDPKRMEHQLPWVIDIKDSGFVRDFKKAYKLKSIPFELPPPMED